MPKKKNVYESYENIADWFDEHRSMTLFEKPYLVQHLTELLHGIAFFICHQMINGRCLLYLNNIVI